MLLKLLIVIVVSILGYMFPKAYNEHFREKYHEEVVSMPLAAATAVTFLLWMTPIIESAFWDGAILVISILICVVAVLRSVYLGVISGAGVGEIITAVVAQMVAIAGVVIVLFILIGMFSSMSGGKKKKRRR